MMDLVSLSGIVVSLLATISWCGARQTTAPPPAFSLASPRPRPRPNKALPFPPFPLSGRRFRNKATFALLWFLYFSLYQVGQTFLGFQWDILLLEAGGCAIIASPLYAWKTNEGKVETSDGPGASRVHAPQDSCSPLANKTRVITSFSFSRP